MGRVVCHRRAVPMKGHPGQREHPDVRGTAEGDAGPRGEVLHRRGARGLVGLDVEDAERERPLSSVDLQAAQHRHAATSVVEADAARVEGLKDAGDPEVEHVEPVQKERASLGIEERKAIEVHQRVVEVDLGEVGERGDLGPGVAAHPHQAVEPRESPKRVLAAVVAPAPVLAERVDRGGDGRAVGPHREIVDEAVVEGAEGAELGLDRGPVVGGGARRVVPADVEADAPGPFGVGQTERDRRDAHLDDPAVLGDAHRALPEHVVLTPQNPPVVEREVVELGTRGRDHEAQGGPQIAPRVDLHADGVVVPDRGRVARHHQRARRLAGDEEALDRDVERVRVEEHAEGGPHRGRIPRMRGPLHEVLAHRRRAPLRLIEGSVDDDGAALREPGCAQVRGIGARQLRGRRREKRDPEGEEEPTHGPPL